MEFVIIGGKPESIELLERILQQNEDENAVRYTKRVKMAENTIMLYYEDKMGLRVEDVRLMMKSFPDISAFVVKASQGSLIMDDHLTTFEPAKSTPVD